MNTFTHWIETPENRPALLAIQRVTECVCSQRRKREVNPVFLHGPSGTGKTHLVSALVAEATARRPDLVATVLAAGDLALAYQADADGQPSTVLASAREADLLIVEDLQHLPAQAAEVLVQLVNARLARQQQMVFTATKGPGPLVQFPARLTSRLAAGLVVGLLPLLPASRRAFLQDRAKARALRLTEDVIDWLAANIGGRAGQLQSPLTRVEETARLQGSPPGQAAEREAP